MGTRKKALLTALVSTSMALAFLMAFAPLSSLPGAKADSDGRVDMVDLLDMILDLDKGTLSNVDVTTPNEGTTVHTPLGVGDTPVSLPLPVSGTATGASEVTFVVDGSFVGSDGWNAAGTMPGAASAAVTDGPPYTSFIDLAQLGLSNLGGSHMIYMLALNGAAPITVADANYTPPNGISPKRNINVNIADPAVHDADGDGFLDNPFALLGSGESWITSVEVMLADGSIVTRQVVIADLSGTGLKAVGDTGIPIDVPGDGAFTAHVNSPTLAELQTADGGNPTALSSATQAVIAVQVAAEPAGLFGTGSPDLGEVDPGDVEIGDRVDLSQFVEVSILYSPDGGTTIFDLDTLPGSETVTLRVAGVSPAENLGANFWSFATDAAGSAPTDISSVAGVDEWDPRFNVTSETAPGTLEADLRALSIFGAFQSAIRIYTIDPNFGPLSGGTDVDLTFGFPGALLTLAEAVSAYTFYFDGTEVTPVGGKGAGATDEWTVTLTSPDLGATLTTAVDVRVQRNAALTEFAEVPSGFTYQALPAITDIDPDFGDVAGGDTVTITGSDFSNLVSVTFGGNAATVVSSSDMSITVTTPAAPSGVPEVVDVVVTTGIGASTPGTFTYLGNPVINSFTPMEGPTTGGTVVTISGSQLAGAVAVGFDGAFATINTNTNNEITVTTAARASGAVPVSVVYPGGLIVTAPGLFTYFVVNGAPVLATVDPDSGTTLGGDTVTLTGANLDNITGVTFGGVDATITGTPTFNQATVVTPANPAGPVDVLATNPAGTSNAVTYTYEDAVAINDITPADAWAFGNVVVEIQGSGFSGAAKGTSPVPPTVTFDGVAATVLANSDTQIFAVVPQNNGLLNSADAMEDVDVTVTQGAASGTAADAFRYYRVATSGGTTTTALAFDDSAGGSADVVLDGTATTSPLATLTIPATTTKGGIADTFALARAANGGPSDFGLNGLDAFAGAGGSTAGQYNFDIHFYQPDATFSTAAGSAAFSEAVVNFPNDDQATLAFPTPTAAGLTTDQVGLGRVALLSLNSTLDQPNPSATANANSTLPTTLAEAYQSTILPSETTDTGGDVTSVTARLRHLTALGLRTNVELDLSSFDIELNPNRGSASGGTTVTITSTEGGLAFANRVTFNGVNGTILSKKQTAADEFTLVVRTPAGPAGTVDVAIFLASDPTTPAVILPDAFRYTTGGGINLIMLALIGAGIALAAGGRSGGGGGGPCFIATAAYGTPMAAELDTLRAVRDTYLLDSAVGTALVDVYYRVSPAIADVVAQSPLLASVVRVLLVPVVFASNLVLAMPKTMVLLGLLSGIAFVAMRRSRKRNQA